MEIRVAAGQALPRAGVAARDDRVEHEATMAEHRGRGLSA